MARTKVTGAQIAAQQAWQSVTLQNGWVNYGNGYDTPGYMKDTLGYVHLRGAIKSGTTTTPTLLFTLPVGYRPAANAYISCVGGTGGTAGQFQLSSDGTVLIIAGGNGFFCLGHVVFLAEN